MENIRKKLAKQLFKLFWVFLLVPFVFYLLWNWLCPILFELPKINFLQSLGLITLSGILFNGYDMDELNTFFGD